LKGLSPEEKLELLSKALASTENAGNRAAAAIAIFGRGGAALIPVLVQQGAALDENVKKAAALTGVTEESVAVSREWTKNMADITVELQRLGNAALWLLPYVEAVGAAIGAGLDIPMQIAYSSVKMLAQGLVGLGKVMLDAQSFQFGDMVKDWQAANDQMKAASAAAVADIKSRFADVASIWGKKNLPGAMPGGATDDDGATPPAVKPPKTGGAGGGTGGGGEDLSQGSLAGYQFVEEAKGPAPQTQSQDMSGIELAQVQSTSAAEMETYRAAAEEKIRLAQASFAELEKTTAFEVSMGQMTAQQRVAALTAAAARETSIRQQQSAIIEMYDQGNLKKYLEDLAKEETAAQQSAAKILQIDQQLAQKQQQQFAGMFQAMTGPFNSFVDHWLTSGQRMGQAFAKMGDEIAMNFINAEIRMLEKHLQTELQKRFITQTTNTMNVASTTAAAATTSGLETMSALQSLNKSAATAAGKAWSAMADIPVVGPVLGAVAAAATYAGVMALAAFEHGGIVDGGGGMAVPILAHAGERVLSQSQTTNFEKMVNQSSSSESKTENHFHDHSNWSGIDGASVEGMYRNHAQAGRRQMVRQLRLANKI
jgi:hypothetical protein